MTGLGSARASCDIDFDPFRLAREYADAGGLMSHGPNIDAIYRQLARFAVKLRKDTSAGEIPIGEPTKFQLVINRHTADAIGIRLSPDFLTSVDRVIE